MSHRTKSTVMRAQEQRQGCSHCKILIGRGESASTISGPNEGSLGFVVGGWNGTVSVWPLQPKILLLPVQPVTLLTDFIFCFYTVTAMKQNKTHTVTPTVAPQAIFL